MFPASILPAVHASTPGFLDQQFVSGRGISTSGVMKKLRPKKFRVSSDVRKRLSGTTSAHILHVSRRTQLRKETVSGCAKTVVLGTPNNVESKSSASRRGQSVFCN
jgi:hypothetical protein